MSTTAATEVTAFDGNYPGRSWVEKCREKRNKCRSIVKKMEPIRISGGGAARVGKNYKPPGTS